MDILKKQSVVFYAVCDHCGKEFESLYRSQIRSWLDSHESKHKQGELNEDNNNEKVVETSDASNEEVREWLTNKQITSSGLGCVTIQSVERKP